MSRMLTFLYTTDAWLLTIFTLGNCKIGQTISSVAWELDQSGKPLGRFLLPLINRLARDANHCHDAQKTYLRITGALTVESLDA